MHRVQSLIRITRSNLIATLSKLRNSQLSFVAVLIVACVIVSVLVGTYGVTKSSAEAPPVPIEAPKIRFNMKPAYKLAQRSQLTQRVKSTPLSMTSADFDRDGAPDLLIGYDNRGAGSITLRRGNPEAFVPADPSVLQRMQKGYDPSSFLPDMKTYSVPGKVDLLNTGDFNGDGNQDVLAGSLNGGLYLLTGSREGDLSAAQEININGSLTGMTAGEFGESDGQLDILVGVAGPGGYQILVFKGQADGQRANPEIYPVTEAPRSLTLARLNSDFLSDLAFVGGNDLEIIHGQPSGAGLSAPVRVSLPFSVSTFAVGDFVNDRNNTQEISALGNDGTLQLVRRADLDTRPFTPEEQLERSRNRLRRVPPPDELTASAPAEWLVAGKLEEGLSPNSRLTTGNVSAASTSDLFVTGDSNRGARARMLVSDSSAISQDSKSDLEVRRSSFSLEGAGESIAVLPLQRKANGVRDIVMLSSNLDVELLPLAPNTTITVDTTSDSAALSACTAAGGDCSLRGAAIYSNIVGNTGTTIIIPANTYPLTLPTATELGNCGEPNAGDLNFNNDLTTLIGAGAATTIIQQTTTNNRVICHNLPFAPNLDFIMSGVTLAGGRETAGVGGGGIVAGGPLNITTINACVFTNNRSSLPGVGTSGVGGGVANAQGSMNISNSIIGGATVPGSCATQATLGCGNQTEASGAGAYTQTNDVGATFTVTNSTFLNNLTTDGNGAGLQISVTSPGTWGTLSVTRSLFSGNVSQGAGANGAGLFYESQGATLNITGSTFLNNSSTSLTALGGAIRSATGANHNVTVTFSRFIGNSVATPANGMSLSGGTGSTMTANDNWWGLNSGPAANHVVNATVANRLTLRNIATPNNVLLGGATTLQADFLVDSASGAIAGSSLFALAGLPVTWSGASKGTLSNQVNAIRAVLGITSASQSGSTVTITTASNHGFSAAQSVTIAGVAVPGYNGTFSIVATPTLNTFTYTTTAGLVAAAAGGTATVPFGLATATFTAGGTSADCGAGGANAQVDSQAVFGAVTVRCPDLTVVKSKTTPAGNPVVGQAWTWRQAIANGGDADANFSIGAVILTDNLPNSANISYSNVSTGIVLGGLNSGTVNCAIDGSKNLSCTAGTAVVIGVAGTFNITFDALSQTVGTYLNPRAAGISTVDPANVVVESNEANNTSTNSVTVDKAATTTTITNAASLNATPTVVGESYAVNWSVTVNAPGSLGAALTGNVTVSDGAATCFAAVSAGTCNLVSTTAGAKSITAAYAGDTNYLASISSPASPHTVNKADTTTTISNAATLTSTPSVTGQSVTVQWSVTVNSPGSVGAALTGNVTVSDGTNSCFAAIATGQCNVTFTSAGAKSLTATYAGDTNYNGSASTPATSHTVNAADTTTTITNAALLNSTPTVVGQSYAVNWSVAVNAPGSVGVALTGNVTVSDGTASCFAAVSAGTCNITSTTAGAKNITATYAGDTNYNGSTSANAPHTVNKANTATTITNAATLNSTPSVVGESYTVNWSVAVSPPGSLGAALTGNVTVSDGTDSCIAAVSAGTCNITSTTAGAKNITATYAGDTNYNGSTSANAPHTVNAAATTTLITLDAPDPSTPGQSVTVNWTVTANPPGGGTPTGNVNVSVSGGVETCSALASSGGCSLVLNTLGVGRVITATYVGNANYATSNDTELHDVIANVTPTVSVSNATVAEPTSGSTNMLFTVALSSPAGASSVTVDYATAVGGANPASAGTDYTAITTTTLTFTTGQQIKTVPVQVSSDADNTETDETLLLNLSGAVGATIGDGQATGTITIANAAGTFLISEIRTTGPGGAGDDFVEVYNNSASPLTVAASDASAGYGLFKMGADCNATPILIGVIPNGTVIPARGHYLFVGSAYSLANYGGTGAAVGNLTVSADLDTDANVAIFNTSDVVNLSSVNRLDAVGFAANTVGNCSLLSEGTVLPSTLQPALEGSYQRDQCGKLANSSIFGNCPTNGLPKDTNNNTLDFFWADAAATNTTAGQHLGAPGPENLASPLLRVTGLTALLVDATQAATLAPNRVRDFTVVPNGGQGTLTIRRRYRNDTGAPVTRLRFRVVDISTAPTSGGVADIRALTSPDLVLSTNDSQTCTAFGLGAPPCNVTVTGTTVETPPSQPNGGGNNTTMTVTLGTPLPAGSSINIQWRLGVQTSGSFKFFINVEALP